MGFDKGVTLLTARHRCHKTFDRDRGRGEQGLYRFRPKPSKRRDWLAGQPGRRPTVNTHKGFAGKRDAVELALEFGGKDVFGPQMRRGTVVPEGHASRLPLETDGKLGPHSVLPQDLQKRLALTRRESDDIIEKIGTDEEHALAGLGMNGDKRVFRYETPFAYALRIVCTRLRIGWCGASLVFPSRTTRLLYS